jgi:hypothetical protein
MKRIKKICRMRPKVICRYRGRIRPTHSTQFTRELNVRVAKGRMLEIGLDYSVHRTIRGLTICRIRRPFERSSCWFIESKNKNKKG